MHSSSDVQWIQLASRYYNMFDGAKLGKTSINLMQVQLNVSYIIHIKCVGQEIQ